MMKYCERLMFALQTSSSVTYSCWSWKCLVCLNLWYNKLSIAYDSVNSVEFEYIHLSDSLANNCHHKTDSASWIFYTGIAIFSAIISVRLSSLNYCQVVVPQTVKCIETFRLSVELTLKKYRNLRANLTRTLGKPEVNSVSDLNWKKQAAGTLHSHMKD